MTDQRNVEWLTTAPNPLSSSTGINAGQRGWKRHAVVVEPTEKFSAVRGRRALCGLQPAHGWSLNLYITDECARCRAKIKGDQMTENGETK